MKKTIIVLICILFTSYLFSHIVPDRNFRVFLARATGHLDNYSPTITDLNSLAGHLDCWDLDISSIEGAQYLINVTYLYFGDNDISDISPLSGLTNLEYLDLQQNNISDISPLESLVNLETLNISESQITDFSYLSGLTNLRSLSLNRTGFCGSRTTDIFYLSGMTELVELILTQNYIRDISILSSFVNMQWLKLNSNQIEDISSLQYLTNLRTLDLRDNLISSISPLSGMSNLSLLWLSDNLISDVTPLSTLYELTLLWISNNQISDVSCLTDLSELHSLFLQNNQLTDVSCLSVLTELSTLRIDNNHVNDISFLSELSDPRDLGLSYNQISDISCLAGFVDIGTLNLRGNNISDISCLSDFGELNWLFLDHNEITDISYLASNQELFNARITLQSNPLSLEAQNEHIDIIDWNWNYLHYDYDINYFAPCYPIPFRDEVNVPVGRTLSWYGNFDIVATYEIYLGNSADSLAYIGIGENVIENTYIYPLELQPYTEYWWKVKAISAENEYWGGLWHFTTGGITPNGVIEQPALCAKSYITNPYPSPFTSNFQFSLKVADYDQAEISIYNLRGQKVMSFPTYSSGDYMLNWDGRNKYGIEVKTGYYFIQMTSENNYITKRILKIK